MMPMTALVLVLALAAPAQTHPNFAGTWVEDEGARKTTMPAPPAGSTALTLPPADTVITQTASDLISERKFMSQVIRYVHHLDGRESVNHNGANTLTTKSAWDGARLVTQGTSFSATSAGEFTWQVKEVRSLVTSGALVVETTTVDEAGKVNLVTRVFRRKK